MFDLYSTKVKCKTSKSTWDGISFLLTVALDCFEGTIIFTRWLEMSYHF